MFPRDEDFGLLIDLLGDEALARGAWRVVTGCPPEIALLVSLVLRSHGRNDHSESNG